MAQRGMNKGVNKSLETWITTSTPYFQETDSKFKKKANVLPFPIAATETFELTQTNNAITLNSASEDFVEVVRRHVISTETAGTLVCRDFKPEMIALANAAEMKEVAETPITATITVEKLGQFVILNGIQKKDSFSLKKGSVELDENDQYILSKGVFQINEDQPDLDPVVVGDILTYTYIRKASKNFQAGTKGSIYGIITVIGHRATETANNLYKITVRVQIDPSPMIGQSAEDFASSTFTFTVLRDPNANTEDGLYSIELATDDE